MEIARPLYYQLGFCQAVALWALPFLVLFPVISISLDSFKEHLAGK
jgi:hypothetical protein